VRENTRPSSMPFTVRGIGEPKLWNIGKTVIFSEAKISEDITKTKKRRRLKRRSQNKEGLVIKKSAGEGSPKGNNGGGP